MICRTNIVFIATVAALLIHVIAGGESLPLFSNPESREGESTVVEFDYEKLRSLDRGAAGESFELPLPNGNAVTLEIGDVSQRESRGYLEVVGETGSSWLQLPVLHELSATGRNGIRLHLSESSGMLLGLLRTPGEVYSVASLGLGGRVAITKSRSEGRAFACEADLDSMLRVFADEPGGAAELPSERTQREDIYVIDTGAEITYDFYEFFGSDVDMAVAYFLGLMAEINEIYKGQVRARHEVIHVRLWSIPNDPYDANNSALLLNQFQELIRNPNTRPPQFELADSLMLFSQGLKEGFATGRAYVGGICRTDFFNAGLTDVIGTYEFPTDNFTWDVAISAHEFAHIIGALHTHCYNPPIDKCFGGESSCYSGPDIPQVGTLMSYCDQLVLDFHPKVLGFLEADLSAAMCVEQEAVLDPLIVLLGQSPIEPGLDQNGDSIIDSADVFLQQR